MPEKTDLLGAVWDAFLIGLQSVGQTVIASPELVSSVAAKLQTPVAEEVRKMRLEKDSKAKPVSSEEINKIANALADKAVQEYLLQVTKSYPFGQFMKSLDRVKKEFDKMPTGVFTEKTLIVVAGVSAFLGILYAMYHTRSGDLVTELATKAAGDNIRFKILNHVEVGVKGIVFIPSTRRIEARGFLISNWDQLKSQFEYNLKLENGELVETSVKGQFIVPVTKHLDLTGLGMMGYRLLDPHFFYDLRLGLSHGRPFDSSRAGFSLEAFLDQEGFSRKYGAEALLKYNWGGERFTFVMGGNYTWMEHFGPGRHTRKSDYGVKMEFGIRY